MSRFKETARILPFIGTAMRVNELLNQKQIVNGPGVSDENTNPAGISDREALKVMLAGTAAILTGCKAASAAVQPAAEPTYTPAATVFPSALPELTATKQPEFRKDTDPDTGIEIISVNGRPLTQTESQILSVKMQESGEYLADPANRTVAFLIGNRAWKKWNTTGVLWGEKVLPYLKRHAVKMNRVFAEKTRPQSGIQNLRMTPLVVLVDEDWIANTNDGERQSNSKDTFGRWSWDISGRLAYDPEKFLNENNVDPESGNFYDDPLMHELMHTVFYISPHLYNYFDPTGGNWTTLLKNNLGIGDIITFRLWNDPQAFAGMNSHMLQNLQYLWENPYVLSEPEELYLKRNLLSQNPPEYLKVNQGSAEFYNDIFSSDFASDYSVNMKNVMSISDKPVLYKSKVKQAWTGDNVEYVFDESFEKSECAVEYRNNETGGTDVIVRIDRKFVSGISRTVDGQDAGFPNAFILKAGGKMLGFTSYHLAYWHWKEQIKQGEQLIGKSGRQVPVEIPVEGWPI